MEKQPKKRYYFWCYDTHNGWRQLGYQNGYESRSECEIDCAEFMKVVNDWQIMEALPVKFKSY